MCTDQTSGLSTQKTLDFLDELRRLLDFGHMPTLVESDELRARDALIVKLGDAERHDRVLLAPNQERRETGNPVEQMRHALVEHVGLPCDARRLRARVFPCLELLRLLLAAEERGKLGSGARIEYVAI